MAARDRGPENTEVPAGHTPTSHNLIVSALARGRVSDEYEAAASRVSHEVRHRPHPDGQHQFPCPVCGSDDVVDVTEHDDAGAMGLCANGHIARVEEPVQRA